MHHHLGIRVVQADYEYMHANFGTGLAGGVASINAARLSAGLVFRVGEIALPTPVALAVSVSPATIYPGDPVSLTAMTANLDPKLNAIYSWSGTGVSGGGTSATVATESLAPGTYTVKAQVREGKPGKEGLKPWESASATGIFTVKAFEPPTISCSASPTAIKPDQKSMVTATGVSPQNRPLTYSYSATAGSINGNGATVSFSPAGAPIGVVAITCTVADDKGQTQSASTSVTIAAPYVPPVPHTQALCSISFAKDKQRPARVNNEAKACLDEVALDLERQPDARIVVVGTSNAKEKARTAMEQDAALRYRHVKVEDLAAERAVNTKDYLVTEKGIDAARVSVATGTADSQTVGDYLVPSGATFTADVAGTTPVDETAVKAQVRKPLPARAAHKRAALE
jgi:outer membrane protein OmpA-like peptidoglycan-associated protein